MMVHLVTFSDESMSRAAQLCQDSAFGHGVKFASYYTPSNLRKTHIVTDHPRVFRQPEDSRRAWAWWAWKPLIIEQSMRIRDNGEILIYSDAGIEFINNVSHIIERMDQDIFLFGNNWEHAHWCKRDVIEAVWNRDSQRLGHTGPVTDLLDFYVDGGASWAMFNKQCQASVIFFRVSDYSRQFVAEWLKWCLFEGGRLIDDSPSRTPNHPEFREHRHDQAILTTLAYREGIKLHYWPASYNDGAFVYEKLPEYADDTYPVLFSHHRLRDSEWQTK